MVEFADCFLLLFGQLAVGGLFALALPPFHEIERGFFKSSAGVFLFCSLVIFLGKSYLFFLLRQAPSLVSWKGAEIFSWLLFAALVGLYLYSLWGNPFAMRARVYFFALVSGVLALTISAGTYRHTPFLSVETFVYPIPFFTSALFLGSAATGMLIGHWYLIDIGLSLQPLRRIFRFYVGALVVHLFVLAGSVALLALAGGSTTVAAVGALRKEYWTLFWSRFLLGPLPSFLLAYMIWRTLQIPQTMAATGLFYIAVLAAVVGEILGRFILFRTALPM